MCCAENETSHALEHGVCQRTCLYKGGKLSEEHSTGDELVAAISGLELSIDADLDVKFRPAVSAVKIRAHTTVKIPEG
jgi:hypothetical protein